MKINSHLFLIRWQYQYNVGIYSCVSIGTDTTVIRRMYILKVCLFFMNLHSSTVQFFFQSKTSRCASCYYKIFYQFLPPTLLILLYGRLTKFFDNQWSFSGCPCTYSLTFKSLLVTWCTNSLTFDNCTFCPHCIYMFCIYLRTNSDLCHLQHKLIGFYNRDEKCLLRGTNWVFK